MDGGDMLSVGR